MVLLKSILRWNEKITVVLVVYLVGGGGKADFLKGENSNLINRFMD